VFSFRGKLHYTNMWRAIVIIVATALLFLPNIGPDLVGWVLVLVGIGQTLLVAVMWTMLADVSHHSKVSPYTVFGFAWVAYALPVALGNSLGSVVAAQANASFLVALLSYALTVSAIITLNDRNFIEGRLFRDLDAAVPDQVNFESIDEKCAEIGAEHKLTKREIEVMKLLCKGRSKSYIAETLFISENTVRSHARHIYQKLNVHSKQEMMDLLMGGGDR
jgi:DNA-binding CsgD family transcriptional regulator